MVASARMLIEGFDLANGAGHFDGLNPDQVALGMPATVEAAPAGGYAEPSLINQALDCLARQQDCNTLEPLQAYPTFRGAMTWSINWDRFNNYNFANTVGPFLQNLP